jgi:hypothetical protein
MPTPKPLVYFAEVLTDKGHWLRFSPPCADRETAWSHATDYPESYGTFRVGEYQDRSESTMRRAYARTWADMQELFRKDQYDDPRRKN